MRKQAYRTYGGKKIVFFVLTILFASFLLSCGTPAQTGSQAKSSPTTVSATTSTPSAINVHVLPTPTAQPVNAAATNGYSTQVAVVNGVAYVGTANNAFYALRASDGALLWHTKIDGPVDEPPVVTDGVVYFSTDIGQSWSANVYALRASDGAQLWVYHAGNNYVPTPLVANGLLYLDAPNGVVALHANDGTQAWHFAAGDNTYIATVVNGVLYLSSHQGDSGPGTAYALRASDGSLLWQYKSSKTLDPPEVINGVAYVGAWDGTLFALRASDGRLLWHTTLSGSSLWMQQVNDVLYVATQKAIYPTASNATAPIETLAANSFLQIMAPLSRTMPHKQILTDLYALRASDGTTLWRSELNNGTDSFASWFVVDNGVIYGTENVNTNLTNHSYVYAMRGGDSKLLWQDETDISTGSAQLANGVIYVTSGNSLQDQTTLYALRESDGSLLWNYPIAATSTNAPILVGNILYIGAENGMVYALSAGTGRLLWHYQTNVNP
jgi:outer membrane protein assembly factor BamB